ncbi:MAG TPA: ATP-binding protein [Terriglobia bacterium]|nr:ATP-binding protein [Terriglobia bacterium]
MTTTFQHFGMPMTPYELLGRLPGFVERLRATPPAQVERDILEVRGWCDSKNQLWKEATDSAVCLANAEGGIVLVGLDSARVIEDATPCPHENVTPEWLQESVRTHSHPPVECTACWLGEAAPHTPAAAQHCIAVLVPRKAIAGMHRTHQGVCLIRRGDRCEVDHLTSQEDYTGILLDDSGMESLSKESLHWAFTNHVVRPRQPQRWRESGRSIEDLLVDFNLVSPRGTGSALTLAAALLFGRREFLSRVSGSAFLRVTINGSGNASSEPYTVHIQQNIADTFRDLWTRRGDLTALTASSLPERCLRELMVNALVHRSYRSLEPVNVRITPDHLLEIQNPGGFLRNLGPRNLINASPVHRNPLLTEAAALLGFCEKSGSGIDIVYQETVASGHDYPYFDGDAEAFTALVPLQRDANLATFIRYRGKEFTRLETLLVLKHLHKTPEADIGQLARVIERPVEFTESLLQELQRRLVIQEDHARFSLSDPVRHEIDNPPDRDQGRLF